jgi:hypothetical protein
MLAQVVVAGGGWTLGHLLIAVIAIVACVPIAAVVIRAMGVAIPPWLVTVFWIVLAAVIGIMAIRLVLGA